MNSNEENPVVPPRCHGHGRRRFLKIPFVIAGIVLIKSALVLLLWNELVPELFHGPTLTYLQAIELTVLAKLLVGFVGLRGFGRGGGGFRGGPPWKGRWAHLSPEEREKLREHLRKSCDR